MPTKHRTRHIQYRDLDAKIDIKIANLIYWLWVKEIRTCQSCQENEPGIVWIQFESAQHAFKFVQKVHDVIDYFEWTNDHCYSVGGDTERCSIRFPQSDIKTILALFKS